GRTVVHPPGPAPGTSKNPSPPQSRGRGATKRGDAMRVKHDARVRRGGFTLVELLVAAAVSILLMVILTEAFKRGIDMFRTLRAQGQMQERLRLASIGLRDDLASFHF